MLYGIDVSNWQGPDFPWDKFRGKIQFAFAKATEGTKFVDPDFAHNLEMMTQLGVVRGAYQLFHPEQDVMKQMLLFDKVCTDAGIEHGDLMSLDHEETDGLQPRVVSLLAGVAAGYMATKWECSPLIYTYQDFIKEGNCVSLGRWPLWRADPWGADMPVLSPWNSVSIDQYATSPEDKDRAYFNSVNQLELLAVGSRPGGHIHIIAPVPPEPWNEDHLWHLWHVVNTGTADAHQLHLRTLWVRYFAALAVYPNRDDHLDHVLVYARDILHVHV